MSSEQTILRAPVELDCRRQLAALAAIPGPRPAGWQMTPRAVVDFIAGREPMTDGGEELAFPARFRGNRPLVERAVVTLASERGLMLIGEPGTAKSWLSEHLAAAISGNSTLTIQGAAGLTEDQVRYGWNYALLLSKGPNERSLVPGPLLQGMRRGALVRFEEITRAPAEIQDTLLSALSDKVMTIPEFGDEDAMVFAKPGFNVIGTANTRDRGVNEMSAALRRRFSFETVAPLADLAVETQLVREKVATTLRQRAPEATAQMSDEVLQLLVTAFRELRSGKAMDGSALPTLTATMSTAEAVAVATDTMLHAAYLQDGVVTPELVASYLGGAVSLLDKRDQRSVGVYWDTVVKDRAKRGLGAWRPFYDARPRWTTEEG